MSIDKQEMHKQVIDLSNEIIKFLMNKSIPNTRLALFALVATISRLSMTTKFDMELLFEYARILQEDIRDIKAKTDITLN